MNKKHAELLQTEEFYTELLENHRYNNKSIRETAEYISSKVRQIVDYYSTISRIKSNEACGVVYSEENAGLRHKGS